MADLDQLNASGSSKIVGSDPTGSETNFANVDSNQQLLTNDSLISGGVHGALTVGTSAIPIRVGISNLTNRKNLTLFNNSNTTMYWGYDNTVSILTGTPIFKDQLYSWDAGENTTIYVVASTAGNNARITEGA